MQRLTVLYDDGCPLCLRCRDWMRAQPAHVALEFLPAAGDEARRRYAGLPRRDQLVVVADDGRAWTGPEAFVVCLWALVEWREWAFRLSSPRLRPVAQRFFTALSSGRHRLAAWLGWQACEDGRCDVAGAHPYR